MSEPLITYELDGNVALIGLNRPDKRNSINDPLIDALRAAVLRAHEEADVAVLFGHGTNFCAGLDLAEALARATGQIKPPRKRKRSAEAHTASARLPLQCCRERGATECVCDDCATRSIDSIDRS